MTLTVVILGFVAIGIVRTVSFAVWNFKEKNPAGGVAMLVLAALATASSFVVL